MLPATPDIKESGGSARDADRRLGGAGTEKGNAKLFAVPLDCFHDTQGTCYLASLACLEYLMLTPDRINAF